MTGFIDMHCDTLLAVSREGLGADKCEWTMIDMERLHAAGARAQFFAMFLPEDERLRKDGLDAAGLIEKLYATYLSSLERFDGAAAARNVREMDENFKAGKLSAFLTIEDGRCVDGKLENIRHFYDMGVRLVTLTWNFENCLGAPNSFDPAVMEKGLTAFGKEAVEYMNELGMLTDVSHLSDGGFWDVARVSKKPFVASHSNCRALSPHPRNLTDEMLRTLGDCGGVTGVNIVAGFLDGDIRSKKSTVSRMADHVMHVIGTAGLETAALGTDWDGTDGEIELSSPDKMQLLFDELSRRGLSDDSIEMIAWKNARRVMADAMK